MKVAEWQDREQLVVTEAEEPRAATGQAVVEVSACGICGSDLHSFKEGLAVKPGQVLGHEFSGKVLEAPGVEGLEPGMRVTARPLIPCGECDGCRAGAPQRCESPPTRNIGYQSPGAFAEKVLIPHAVVGETVFPLPNEVSDAAATLVEPLAVGLHAVELADPDPHDVVLVLGAGMIGLGVVRLLKLRGVERIIVAEISALRRERALSLGAERVIDPGEENTTKVMASITGPGAVGLGARADVIFDCAGAEAALHEALKSAKQGGKIVLTAIFGKAVSAHLDRIVEKELQVVGSYAYNDEFPRVIELLARGDVNPELILSHTFPLEQIDAAFRTQLDPATAVKVVVTPEQSPALGFSQRS